MAPVLMFADAVLSDPCVLFALRRESMFFRRAYPFQRRFPGAPCRAQFRGSPMRTMLMLETGLGASAMETALRWCLSMPHFGDLPYRPQFVLSAGFSGALQADLGVADLILATEICDDTGRSWPATWPADLSSGTSWPGLQCGRLLTLSYLAAEPEEKHRLGHRFQALAVDIETAIVARLCQEHRVRFGCLRAISDELNTPLSPRLVDLLQKGRVSLLRLASVLLRQPALLSELLRLARETRKAAQKLSAMISLLCSPVERE